jgi:ribose/xylose/arabinose/galactoside ABC-type transport system permease subunit
MVTPEFQPFFMASVGASAGLIGLLFVSVSVAPERVFGPQSDAVRQAQALSAFSALANVFFISLMSLVPGVIFGLVVTFISVPAIIQTLALLGLARQWSLSGIVGRGLLLFLASAAVYGYELALGIQIWRNPTGKGALINLLIVLMGAYAIGLGRAWELLGAPRTGVISGVLETLARRLDRRPKPKS